MMYMVYSYGGPHLDQRKEERGQKNDLTDAFKLARELNKKAASNESEKITHFVYDEHGHRMPN